MFALSGCNGGDQMVSIKRQAAIRLLMASVAVMIVLQPVSSSSAQTQLNGRTLLDYSYFTETSHGVRGRFMQYWETHGGLAQQGYPISWELYQVSLEDGKVYGMQYFERAVFEYHPENTPPNDVLLQRLGAQKYDITYSGGAPPQEPNNSPGSAFFAETGHRLGGRFLAYWKSHGGLAQQGYPISDEFFEQSAVDGQVYRVQYFERAIFEYHPEKQPPYDVLLSLIGSFYFDALYKSADAGEDSDGDGIANIDDVCPYAPEGQLNNVFDTDGCPDTIQTLMDLSIVDVNEFWSQVFEGYDAEYQPPDVVAAYTSEFMTPCGFSTELDNAFSCTNGRGFYGIYYDQNLMVDALYTGDFAPAVVIAHEWGHHIQKLTGIDSKYGQLTIKRELQADCLAGVWASFAGQASNLVKLEEGDLEEGASSLFNAGSLGDWTDPDNHGTPDQRRTAYLEGVQYGNRSLESGLDWCADR